MLYFVVYLFVYFFFVAQIAALQEQVRFLQSAQACILHISVFVNSLTSPYRHLYNTDTYPLRTVRLVPEMPKIVHSLPL